RRAKARRATGPLLRRPAGTRTGRTPPAGGALRSAFPPPPDTSGRARCGWRPRRLETPAVGLAPGDASAPEEAAAREPTARREGRWIACVGPRSAYSKRAGDPAWATLGQSTLASRCRLARKA